MAIDIHGLALECAPGVHPTTMAAVVQVESANNPYAIGVVGGRLARQPKNKAEAIATAKALAGDGWNFSMGAGQVNRHNLNKYGLTFDTAFEPCANLRAGSSILKDCYTRALAKFGNEQRALQAAFSCYYSGNFSTGFKPDFKGQPSYVQKVLSSAGSAAPVLPTAPAPTGAQAIPVFGAQSPAKRAALKDSVPALAVKSLGTTNSATLVDAAVADLEPVVLKAVPNLPRKPRNVPAQYDGFASNEAQVHPFDGYSSNEQGREAQ
jgi:type IV secretion system protein VirB1